MSRIAKHSDLTRTEGDPTARAYVDLPLEQCELTARLGPGRSGEFKLKTRTAQQSHLAKAATAFLLIAGGCLAALVMHLIHAPGWAQLSGMPLPWIITLSLNYPHDNTKKAQSANRARLPITDHASSAS